jgi:hypothetical protein
MATQYTLGYCPLTNCKIDAFPDMNGINWGICRKTLDWQYLDSSFIWVTQSTSKLMLPSKEENEAKFKAYIKQVLHDSVKPLLFDSGGGRIAFKCNHCSLIHKSSANLGDNGGMTQITKRACPKLGDPLKITRIRLWDNNTMDRVKDIACSLTAPVGIIDKLPNWNCKECFASGEYTGFIQIEPCSTCFPKPKPA